MIYIGWILYNDCQLMQKSDRTKPAARIVGRSMDLQHEQAPQLSTLPTTGACSSWDRVARWAYLGKWYSGAIRLATRETWKALLWTIEGRRLQQCERAGSYFGGKYRLKVILCIELDKSTKLAKTSHTLGHEKKISFVSYCVSWAYSSMEAFAISQLILLKMQLHIWTK